MRLLSIIEQLNELGCTGYRKYSEDTMYIKDSNIEVAEIKV